MIRHLFDLLPPEALEIPFVILYPTMRPFKFRYCAAMMYSPDMTATSFVLGT